MINSVYNYYAAQYGHREYSKYDTHSKAQLKSTFGRLQKINSQTPSYKIDFSDAALKYAIDLKENARELSQIADELSDESTDSITYKRSATSSSPQVIDAEYIGDSCVQDYEPLEVTVSQLACPQTNTGNFLQPNSKPFAAGEYSFDLQAITGARDFGGYLYFIVMEYRLDMDSKTHYADERLYRYDYGNGIAEKVIDKQVSDYFVLGDTLVYFESGTGLYVYDFKTQKETLEVQADKNILVAGISYDGQYFYLDNAGMGSMTDAASRIERVIYVYDRSFNLIREIDCGKDCTGVYFGDEKYLFIKQLDTICYIKKEDILNAEWVQLK